MATVLFRGGKFDGRSRDFGSEIMPATLLVDGQTSQEITVDFGDSDVDVVGKYEWHVEAVFSGKRMDFPERSFYTFSVTETIAAS